MLYKYPDSAILVFCKAPIIGQVKTRLTPDLTVEQAANAHVELSRHMLALLSESQLCPIELWCSPDTTHPFFGECLTDYPLSLHQQQGGDLGERMHHAISASLKAYSKVLLIGSDVPSLTAKDFDFALKALNHKDVVITPAQDGGYVMIGMIEPHGELFEGMQWGHKNVFNDTKNRIDNAKLSMTITAAKWDVDYVDDWLRFKNYSFS